MPQGRLPLNIFEPRYVAMVEDALKGDRMIGMVQPQQHNAESTMSEPPVYGKGCAGRITSFRETRDGRFEIVLDGISRFEIVRESGLRRGYRVAEVRWDLFAADRDEDISDDSNATAARARILVALRGFLTGKGSAIEGSGVTELPLRELIAAVAMSCPFAPAEKQALLEAQGVGECAALLVSLLDMAVHESEGRTIPRQ